MMFWGRRKAGPNLVGTGILLAVAGLLALSIYGLIDLLNITVPSYWSGPVFYGSLLIATLLVVRYYDRMPPEWVGLGLHRWVRREIGWGILIGAGMALLAWSPAAIFGSVEFRGVEQYDRFLYWGLFILASGIGEELLFRGYLFQRGIELFGSGVAVVLFSAGFALAHLGNPDITPVGLINIFLGGIFFSACYLAVGSLWLPMAVHVSFNMMLTLVLGTPASGWLFEESVWLTTVNRYDFLTGGAFGPEGGIGATLALVVGGVFLLVFRSLRMAPWSFSRIFFAFYARRREEAQDTEGQYLPRHRGTNL